MFLKNIQSWPPVVLLIACLGLSAWLPDSGLAQSGKKMLIAHRGASAYLGQIRALLWAGKQKEAEDLAMREFMSVPVRQKAYQALADLELEFVGAGEATGYRRSLDLDTRDGRVCKLFLDGLAQLQIFRKQILVIALGVPARLPAFHDAEPETSGMYFMSQ